MLAHRTTFTTTLALVAGLALPALAVPTSDLPITDITLYRSGVGAFTHLASVEGTETFELRFATEDVDDILKSLLLLDASGNGTFSVNYQSREDLARRLRKFSIDINAASSITGLLGQLRGVTIELITPEGTRTGTILGVETDVIRTMATSPPSSRQTDVVNIITTNGIRSVAIDTISSFELIDEELAAELNKALATLVENRTDNLRDMSITFRNDAEQNPRDIAISYVHEMPVWKTAYRFVIPAEQADEDKPSVTLQAWAIIENTTGTDWEDVRLSLAAGRPASFTMDLDRAIYAHRPQFPVPVAGGGIRYAAMEQKKERRFAVSGESANRQMNETLTSQSYMGRSEIGRSGTDGAFAYEAAPVADLDSLGGGVSTGEQAGGQFLFTMDEPLTLPSQESAMLPLAVTTISGEPVSYYNFNTIRDHPKLGVRFTNDSGLHLMPGPITVFDAGRYAGDAQIPHTSRNETQNFTYALDLDVHASRDRKDASYDIAYSINDGLLRKLSRHEITWTYTFENHDTRTRALIVEHSRHLGEIFEPKKMLENKNGLSRHRLDIEPGESETLTIIERSERSERYQLTSNSIEQIVANATPGTVSNKIIRAMKTIAEKNHAISELNSRINEASVAKNNITSDQGRIRNNMNRLDRNSDLYARYYKTLNTQEDELETIHSDRADLQRKLREAQADLHDFLANLTID